jgi:hypothetical protein
MGPVPVVVHEGLDSIAGKGGLEGEVGCVDDLLYVLGKGRLCGHPVKRARIAVATEQVEARLRQISDEFDGSWWCQTMASLMTYPKGPSGLLNIPGAIAPTITEANGPTTEGGWWMSWVPEKEAASRRGAGSAPRT